MKKIINNTMQPIMLESGQVLPAGATRDDIELTETDRARHVPARITVIEDDMRIEPDVGRVMNNSPKLNAPVLDKETAAPLIKAESKFPSVNLNTSDADKGDK